MADTYDFLEIEQKWQTRWEASTFSQADSSSSKPKYYALIEFPYPSSEGLHVGHPRSYVGMDIVARKRRMEGYNVLFPIGWDAFGLPAENYAIKTGIHPSIITKKNIANFRRQLKMLGISFDWSREVDTTDPNYYKWTQWIFLRLFKRGLAYKAEIPINWCTSCKVGLANEEVVGGVCERCGAPVVRKAKKQWMLGITKYADRLLEDLQTIDYLEKIKTQQTNWIGKSYGAELKFEVPAVNRILSVFTTRPDTIFGATYMVLSPEHPLIEEVIGKIENPDEIRAYQTLAASKSELERTDLSKDKTGVELKGMPAINPATGEAIPVWISDYVLISYGTGAIMAVPAHDTRDYEFAKKFGLRIIEVISGGDIEKEAYTELEGVMVNSGFLNGLLARDAIGKAIEWFENEGKGERTTNYKLRDWVFSRQRYWGEPIPLVECEQCGWIPIPEEELPVLLPEVESFVPSSEGESLLATIPDWVDTTCPACGGKAKRETDTMPQWAGSSWYFLRYIDPHNDHAFASRANIDYWMPVDWYNGGMEHTTLHLLYSRFWHKFLYDEGLVSTPEPYSKRTSHGMILGSDGEKMSKSRGNVVNPDEIVGRFGADTFRVYEMFMGAFDLAAPWSTEGVVGVSRFLNRVWAAMHKVDGATTATQEQLRLVHRTVMRVDERIENMKFNTAVSELMTYTSELLSYEKVPLQMFRTLCVLLSPFAPHIACEMWERVAEEDHPLSDEPWPSFDPELAKAQTVTMAVQINGKLSDTISMDWGMTEEDVLKVVYDLPKVKRALDGKSVRKVIHVPNKIVNLVVK
jgi:leucyl-tRNA synthetase